jgi:hypothetical protein
LKKTTYPLSEGKGVASQESNHVQPASSSSLSSSSSLPEDEIVIMTLQSTLSSIQAAADQIAAPMCSLVFQRFSQAIQGMYSEDFGIDRQVMEVNSSQYMDKICALLNSFGSDISQFGHGDLIQKHIEELVSNLVQKFILHACLLPHISSSGILRLTKDMAQLEVAIGAFHPRFSKNIPQKMSDPKADPYQKLRAFRQLLFRDLSEIPKCPEIEYFSLTLILHHLFSRAPLNSLISPIQFKRCNLQQYCKWLEEADEPEVWELVKSCLEEYVKKVNLLGEKEFCDVYPILMTFPQWGLGRKT